MRSPLIELAAETFTRSIKVGDSEAWFGLRMVMLISRPFTPGEDAVVAWVCKQDECVLADLVHLKDGRDFMVLERLHVRQSWLDAVEENHEFRRLMARFPMQHGSTDTPNPKG